MKTTSLITFLTACSMGILTAAESFREDLEKSQSKTNEPAPIKADVLKKHRLESIKTANDQDEVSADVQDLIQEQTDPKVVALLAEAEDLMVEAVIKLENAKTGGETIAIETEIIEKIYEAAKQKQKSSSKGEGEPKPSPMLEMMEGMMGKGKQPGEGKGEKPGEGEGKGEGEGDSGGEGKEGNSDKTNDKTSGTANNTKEERRVPKNTSAPNRSLPREEQRALDAYNKTKK